MADIKKKPPVMDEFKEILLEQVGFKERPKAPLAGEIDLAGLANRLEKKQEKIGNLLQQKEREIYNSKEKLIQSQVANLMKELAVEVTRLQQQTAELTQEVRAATVEVLPVKPGAYHLNFFDWVIGTLRDLRKRVNESRLWLNMWTQKKRQRGYWQQFAKHGLKFAMSDERSVATAAG